MADKPYPNYVAPVVLTLPEVTRLDASAAHMTANVTTTAQGIAAALKAMRCESVFDGPRQPDQILSEVLALLVLPASVVDIHRADERTLLRAALIQAQQDLLDARRELDAAHAEKIEVTA